MVLFHPRPAVTLTLLAALVIATVGDPTPQQPAGGAAPSITVSADPYTSIDTGADLTFAAISALARLEDRAFSRLKRDWRTDLPIGILKTVLLDHPIAIFMLVVQHEAFGHGGRAREFGANATFRMGSPWTRNALFNGGTRFGGGASWDGVQTHEQIGRIYAGGTEANTRSATHIERDLVAGTSMEPVQLLYFIRSRWYPSQYVLRTPHPARDPAGFFAEASGGDVANYLGELNYKYYGASGITADGVSATLLTEYERLRRHAMVNLAGPGAWLALWGVASRANIGEVAKPIPLPRIAGWRFLPVISADWMVDGGAISVETMFGRGPNQSWGPRWFSLVGRQGHGPGGRFWNAGGATERIATWRSLHVAGEVEMWKQPSFGFGAGVNAQVVVSQGLLKGLLVHGGLKSDGDWPGRPANGGGFFRVGYRYSSR